MLDPTLGIITLVIVCAVFLVLGVAYAWRRGRQSAEDYTVSRNHAPVNVGIATLVASMFGTWVLLSPGETGANFGIVALVGYALGMAGIPVMFMFVGPRIRQVMPNGHSITEYVRHPLRHGAFRGHFRGHHLCHRHIHYGGDDGYHGGGEHPHRRAGVGHGGGGGPGGNCLHRLWRAAGVHLYRPHPVLGVDAGPGCCWSSWRRL